MATLLDRLAPTACLRTRDDGPHLKVTTVELFFDLVYVFTIIQLSHHLLEHQTWMGALETATLFAAVWWAWNYTAWSANWIDPDRTAGRNLMLVLMACALMMAVAIHYAFGYRAWLFVLGYVSMALIRAFYMSAVMRGTQMGQNYFQLGMWSVLSGVFWVAGALVESMRLQLWIIAVLIDYAGPYAGFWVLGKGRTPMETWTLKGLHLLERNQLIFIIALGESILLLGGTMVRADLNGPLFLTASIGFMLIVSMWWLYFVHTGEQSEYAFETEAEQTRLARAGLAYAHGIMVGGAIVVAVAIEEIIAHPTDPANLPAIIIAVAGPLIFLTGNALFRRTLGQHVPISYLVPFAVLPLIGYAVYAAHPSGIVLGLGMLVVMLPTALINPSRAAT
ncbi:low temperature requirement protein A [Cognatishimia sp. MH4019]|uniref:low temperature requirement protein A n=1 Tax=Cognatishimia sp. MH4019 TaxID=2854030 RepID=UPI001CD1D0BE|nr:low temperature requirement protein A [Cognatishimia sp. MH4019]